MRWKRSILNKEHERENNPRRQLATVINAAAASSAVLSLDVIKAIAQTPAGDQDLDSAARESHKRNSGNSRAL